MVSVSSTVQLCFTYVKKYSPILLTQKSSVHSKMDIKVVVKTELWTYVAIFAKIFLLFCDQANCFRMLKMGEVAMTVWFLSDSSLLCLIQHISMLVPFHLKSIQEHSGLGHPSSRWFSKVGICTSLCSRVILSTKGCPLQWSLVACAMGHQHAKASHASLKYLPVYIQAAFKRFH